MPEHDVVVGRGIDIDDPGPPRRPVDDRDRGVLLLRGEIDPGRVFDLDLPLDDVGEGYRAMDERRAIKTFLRP